MPNDFEVMVRSKIHKSVRWRKIEVPFSGLDSHWLHAIFRCYDAELSQQQRPIIGQAPNAVTNSNAHFEPSRGGLTQAAKLRASRGGKHYEIDDQCI